MRTLMNGILLSKVFPSLKVRCILSTSQAFFLVSFRRYTNSHTFGAIDAMDQTARKPTYDDALQLLNSTQTGFKVLEERRRLCQKLDGSAVEQMRQWIHRLGYATGDLNRLNIVHVAGTKGKGTTCAFVNSILQKYHQSHGIPRKIGLYTSPHLVAVRERIRINSEPISEEQFTTYFFEVWYALESSAIREGLDPALKPSYFRFLTLMSFHVFLRENAEVAIYEVGVGGELDSTNIIEQPAVAGITSLGIDHVATLGDTIDKIAWHKTGIFKNGCPAFTVQQVPEAMQVLEERAIEKRVKLATVEISPSLQNIDIRPAEDFQRKNASLAVKLSFTVLKKLGVATENSLKELPEHFVHGLESVVWRGRCETLISGQQYWYLDGAHTEESLEVACSWFGRISKEKEFPRVLIFNQQSTRDAVSLLKAVHHAIYHHFKLSFQHALFCTNITHKGNSYKVDFVNRNTNPDALQSLQLQKELAAVWHDMDPNTEVAALPSIEDAIDHVRNIYGGGRETQILVTGSFHLVGGALSVLEGQKFALARSTAK